MAYLPNNWVDQNVERPKTYNFTQNDDGSTSLIDAFGNVTELGTPVNADYMNHIEEGIAGCAVRKYSKTETYGAGEWVQGKIDDKQGLYESLTDNNTANPLTDQTKWKKVEIGGGNGIGLPMGMLIPALFPIESDCIRRTDGSILMQDGELAAGVKFIKEQIALYPSLGLTESDWQAMKAQYGEVPAFVIDDEAGTIRLPLIVNPIKGVTDLSRLGQIVEAGLPDHTHTYETKSYTAPQAGSTTLCWVGGTEKESGLASKSNEIYGKSDTVQPQQPTGCYYIVLATGTTEDYTALEEFAPIEVYTLLESKYSEGLLYNPAWLRSNGQWNAKAVYPTVFDILLIEHNSNIEAGTTTENGYTKRGLPVKLSTEEYTDYDFVINTADETFRLPLKNGREGALIKTAPVVSDGLMTFRSTSTSSLVRNLNTNNGNYVGEIIEGSNGTGPYAYESGLVADLEAASIPENYYLYFYVGNVTQNASVINAGRIQEQLVDLASRVHVVETYQNGVSGYRLWSDGRKQQWGRCVEVDNNWQTVTLIKKYSNKNYNISLTSITPNAAAGSPTPQINGTNIQEDFFQWHIPNGAGWSVFWSTSGY